MKQLLRHQALLVLAAGLVFFTYLGSSSFFDEDESRNAACSAEMFRQGAWIVPTFNDELQTKTPILVNWFMLVLFRLLGISEFSARFTSSVMAVATTLLTYHLGRKLYSSAIGFLAGIILCSCLLFSVLGRAATPDSMFSFFVTLALTSYVVIAARQRGGSFSRRLLRHTKSPKSKSNQEGIKSEVADEDDVTSRPLLRQLVPDTWKRAAPMFAAMGMAVLTCGPVGVVLPCSVILLFLLTSQRFDDIENA